MLLKKASIHIHQGKKGNFEKLYFTRKPKKAQAWSRGLLTSANRERQDQSTVLIKRIKEGCQWCAEERNESPCEFGKEDDSKTWSIFVRLGFSYSTNDCQVSFAPHIIRAARGAPGQTSDKAQHCRTCRALTAHLLCTQKHEPSKPHPDKRTNIDTLLALTYQVYVDLSRYGYLPWKRRIVHWTVASCQVHLCLWYISDASSAYLKCIPGTSQLTFKWTSCASLFMVHFRYISALQAYLEMISVDLKQFTCIDEAYLHREPLQQRLSKPYRVQESGCESSRPQLYMSSGDGCYILWDGNFQNMAKAY